MRPALDKQCLVRGAANLVPLAAAPERKRVTLDYTTASRPLYKQRLLQKIIKKV